MPAVVTPIGFNFTGIPSSHTHVPPDVVAPIPNTHWGGSPDGSSGYYDAARGTGWEEVDDTGYPRSGWRGGNSSRISGEAYGGGIRTFRIDVQPGIYRIGAGLSGDAVYRVIDDQTIRLALYVNTVGEQFVTAGGDVLTEAQWITSNGSGYGENATTREFACASGIVRIQCEANGGNFSLRHIRLAQVSSFNPPTITADPTSVEVSRPATATFSVTLGGGSYTALRWQTRPTSSGTISDISGANTTSYTTGATDLPMSGSQYRLAADWAGGTVYSAWATLTVNAGPAGVPTDLVASVSGVTATLNWTRPSVQGTSATLQWAVLTSPIVWNTVNVPGGAGPVVVGALSPAGQYTFRVLETNSAGTQGYSDPIPFATDNVVTGSASIPPVEPPPPEPLVISIATDISPFISSIALAQAPGFFNFSTLKNGSGMSIIRSDITAVVRNETTDAVLFTVTNLSAGANGGLITNAAIVAGTKYRVTFKIPGGAEGTAVLTGGV